jgi:serine/threonine protein kinase
MFNFIEPEQNVLYPASFIGLLETPIEIEYRRNQQYEDVDGNRYLEDNGNFFGLSFQTTEERYLLLENLPNKGRTLNETFILKAKDSKTGNIVATKTGPMHLLIKEAQVMAQVIHPNIAQFIGLAASINTDPCLILEWLHGGTLEDQLKGNKEISISRIAKIFNDTAMAVNHAHQEGHLHGDIKPQNIMFNERKQTKVIDFGNSFPLIESSSSAPDIECACTIDYAPPEQISLASKGQGRLHIQSDIYSLAAVMYGTLTLEVDALAKMFRDLFVEEKDTFIQLSKQHQEILTQSKQKLLSECLRRALAFDYHNRHNSVMEFNLEVQEILA